jgi:hypothetical protein
MTIDRAYRIVSVFVGAWGLIACASGSTNNEALVGSTAGSGGQSGESGAGGAGAMMSAGGNSGQAGTAGMSGTAGMAGMAGDAGQAGAGQEGGAGQAGEGGNSGQAGMAGTSTAGMAGTSGAAGSSMGTPLKLVTEILVTGKIEQAYTTPIQASGGDGEYSWQLTAGTLPTGIALTPTGTPGTKLSGMPIESGAFPITIEVSTMTGQMVTKDYVLTIDGKRWLIYLADQEVDGQLELYGSNLSGSTPSVPQKFNGPLVTNGDVVLPNDSEFAPDGSWMLYRADQGTDQVTDLYAVRLNVSPVPPAVKVNNTLPTTDDVLADAWSPDSKKVVYRAGHSSPYEYNLFYVDMSGSNPKSAVKLNQNFAAGGSVYSIFKWSANSKWFGYLSRSLSSSPYEMYLVEFTNGNPGSPVKVNSPLVANGAVSNFSFSPTGDSLIYLADQNIDGATELFWVDLSTGSPAAPVRLNQNLPTNASVKSFEWSPDGKKIAYLADANVSGLTEAFVLNVPSGSPQRINANMVSGGNVYYLQWHPNSQRILYCADQEIVGQKPLYDVDVSGAQPSTPLRLGNPTNTSADVYYFGSYAPQFSFDASGYLFRADLSTNGEYNLYHSSTMTIEQTTVANAPLQSTDDVYYFGWSPVANQFAYIAGSGSALREMFFVNATAGTPGGPVKVNAPFASGGSVQNHYNMWSPDGRWLAYRADQTINGSFELFATKVSGTSLGSVSKVSGDMVSGGYVFGFVWSP